MTEQRGTPPLILVVDDDPGMRRLAAASLRQAGYATTEAADGDDGISAFRRSRPDLVLLDLLKSFGCDLAQGFLFSKAVPAAEFTRLLGENRRMTV